MDNEPAAPFVRCVTQQPKTKQSIYFFMGFFVVLMLKSACYTLGFYLIYRLLLCRDTFYRFNREALRLMFCISFLLPCVTIPTVHFSIPTEGIGTVDVTMGYLMGTVEEPTSQAQFNWLSLLLVIYGAGVIFFATRSIICYISLTWMLYCGRRAKLSQYSIHGYEDIHLIVHHDKMSPFSWMNYIVISEQDLAENGAAAIAHEMGHIRFGHTLDLICTEIFVILQWFNPAIWLMRRELQAIHEYQADEEVLAEGIDARQYQLLLIEKATGTRLQSITCSLHQSSIKKRITMMLKKKSNPWARAKVLFAIPVAITGIAVFSCSESASISDQISECKVSEIFADNQTSAPESAAPVATSAPKPAETPQDEEAEGNQVFMICEQMPSFSGGEQELMKFIRQNLKYPTSCIKDSVQGRVVATFVVEKDGSISDVKIVKSVHPDMEAEAIRVIKAMPKWTPGTQRGQNVRVKYALPITFRLQ